MSDKDTTWYDLMDSLRDELSDAVKDGSIDLKDEDSVHDRLSEIVDGIVPIYNYDLCTVIGSNLELGCRDLEWDSKTPFDAMREAIYLELREEAYDWIKEEQDRLEEA